MRNTYFPGFIISIFLLSCTPNKSSHEIEIDNFVQDKFNEEWLTVNGISTTVWTGDDGKTYFLQVSNGRYEAKGSPGKEPTATEKLNGIRAHLWIGSYSLYGDGIRWFENQRWQKWEEPRSLGTRREIIVDSGGSWKLEPSNFFTLKRPIIEEVPMP